MVVNEACAAGLPILCSRSVGACESLVEDRVNGYLFDPRSVSEIANAMLRFHLLNPEHVVSMGLKSESKIRDFEPIEFGRGALNAIKSVELRKY